MVVESIINPTKAKEHPFKVFFLGAFYASLGILLSLFIFKEHATLVMVFLTTMAAVPLLYHTILSDERKHFSFENHIKIFEDHSKILSFLTLLFLGMTVAFTLWYVFLPKQTVNNLFSSQTQTIISINNQISGQATQQSVFLQILSNNLKVLIFSILFSFIYGVGAIFILTWNASVIGTAMGNLIRKDLATVTQSIGLENATAYFQIFSTGFLRYAFHGIPEMLAYFVGGLAGGIISAATIRGDLRNKKIESVLLDVSTLILLAIIILIIAGLLEVYITPQLF